MGILCIFAIPYAQVNDEDFAPIVIASLVVFIPMNIFAPPYIIEMLSVCSSVELMKHPGAIKQTERHVKLSRSIRTIKMLRSLHESPRRHQANRTTRQAQPLHPHHQDAPISSDGCQAKETREGSEAWRPQTRTAAKEGAHSRGEGAAAADEGSFRLVRRFWRWPNQLRIVLVIHVGTKPEGRPTPGRRG